MEVASPLPFGHASAGGKRHLPCSPGIVDSTNCGPFMEPPEEFHQRAFKRRRFAVDESMGLETENATSQSPFLLNSMQQQRNHFNSSANDQSVKRCRTEALSPQHETHKVIEAQVAEIASLKTDKLNLETSFATLRTEHEKVVNENRILKRAVTIQQERQNHSSSEIEAANRYKVEADDRIKKLEQIILSLRYHLQAQHTNPGNDFMGFPPRPPDVY
eukprot:CAMPEP_0117015464 /NCGR_PEP_ID=MMETSP0472-20121206/12353_1 /TAXON_ID=693140 ORGANISM="Tiarina fusus, Strain LIS" /NCGR_SAMPLE_ID=MMETSP0472 /ASSEMBLY_ACC=CAM_ASM_000603 /LENGTH=216 /DNA_ID=CAMNT_0004719277 /DNA_START=67 /DNA_END=717 /DNA_ORIENTATION=+